MSWHLYDPIEWETVVTGETWPGPLGVPVGSFGVSYRRKPDDVIAKLKAERERLREDAVLAEADAIRVRRLAQ